MSPAHWGKVLVIGAGGQLGQELQHTAPEHITCVAMPRDALDISDRDAVTDVCLEVRPTAVINAAAYTAVDKAEQDSDAAYRINRDGPAHVAMACAAAGIRLLHVSTDFVFDGTSGVAYSEDALTSPLGVYGNSKLAGEDAVRESGADALIVRTGWVYSQYGANFVKTMLRLMVERDRLGVVEDQVGTPTWARGLAQVCWQLVTDSEASGTYHWSDAGAASWYDFALAIRDEALQLGLLTRCPEVVPIAAVAYPTPATRPAFSVLDKSRSRERLGFEGQHWRLALQQMLTAMRATH